MATRPPTRAARAFLRGELPRWRAEGIVDARAAEELTRRYGLDEPAQAGLAVAALYVLAACLVGAGVISLVAWHWEELPRALRLSMLGGALVAAHGVGFWLWQVTGRRPRLGHALSFLGTLVFGAALGLVAQLFHVSGVWYGLFGAWALGALAAGLALPSPPALALAVVLGLYVWGPGFLVDHAPAAEAVAWALGGAALLLAFAVRSRALFLLAYVGLGVVLTTALVARGHDGVRALPETFSYLASVAAALALARQRGAPHPFAGVAGSLGRLALYLVTYVLSFEAASRELAAGFLGSRAWFTRALPAAVATAALLVTGWRSAGEGPARAVAVVAAGFAALLTLAVEGTDVGPAVWILAHLAALAVATIQVAHGLRAGLRGPFWEGLAVAAVIAVSRFFEIEEALWLKGVGFIAAGVALIVCGLVFERRLRGRGGNADHA